jgi:N6-adenosine-specific RNA methylase IME4
MKPKIQPLLRGLRLAYYGAILVDPPWAFKSYAKSANPESDRHVERHYRTMTGDDIKALPIRKYAAATGCHLFLWTTGPFLPQALDTMATWGFKYSGVGFTWVKLKKSHDANQLRVLPSADGDFHVGLGFTTRKNTEFCLQGRWGNARRLAKDVRELIIAPRREHSRKPDEVHERIERYCAGPYLELFGREKRPNWTVRGDEVGKFP